MTPDPDALLPPHLRCRKRLTNLQLSESSVMTMPAHPRARTLLHKTAAPQEPAMTAADQAYIQAAAAAAVAGTAEAIGQRLEPSAWRRASTRPEAAAADREGQGSGFPEMDHSRVRVCCARQWHRHVADQARGFPVQQHAAVELAAHRAGQHPRAEAIPARGSPDRRVRDRLRPETTPAAAEAG
jgi:hypothetical protein